MDAIFLSNNSEKKFNITRIIINHTSAVYKKQQQLI